jgi:hypothetical protein
MFTAHMVEYEPECLHQFVKIRCYLMDAFVGMPVSGLPRVGDCFGLCLFGERGELFLSLFEER